MNKTQHQWGVVLAAGAGTRLSSLTTDRSGRPTPKQYCALGQGSTLIEDAIHRAGAIVERSRLCTVVASEHREWWQSLRAPLGKANVIVQPANRGTGIGILLALHSILVRDRDATMLFLPADHYVRNEAVLAGAMQRLLEQTSEGDLMMLGISPDEPDPELGYIVQGRRMPGGHYLVRRFVEKPEAWLAKLLVDNGCMWNSFIFAARGSSLLAHFRTLVPEAVAGMESLLATAARSGDSAALAAAYAQLPVVDFSRDILQRSAQHLRVVAAPRCGWSDLGTPRSLYKCLQRQRHRETSPVRQPLPGLQPQVSLSQAVAALKWS